jgi:hypothetical protein
LSSSLMPCYDHRSLDEQEILPIRCRVRSAISFCLEYPIRCRVRLGFSFCPVPRTSHQMQQSRVTHSKPVLYNITDIINRSRGPGINQHDMLPRMKMITETAFISTSLWMLLKHISSRWPQCWCLVNGTESGSQDVLYISSPLPRNH